MKEIEIAIYADGADGGTVYGLLSDFCGYPQLTTAVRSVTIHQAGGDHSVSTWEVNFREGILRWTERDRFDHDRRRIEFVQIEGDLEIFEGSWQVTEDAAGCAVVFRARFDLGIPTLADLLDPIAEAALRESIGLIVNGVFTAAAQAAPVAAVS